MSLFRTRLFKFRAFDLEEQCLVEAWEPSPDSMGWIEGSTVELDQLAFTKGMHIMQFTGLYDRLGQEIYEGDVLVSCEEGLDREWFSVIFDSGAFCLADYPAKDSGNVYYRNWPYRMSHSPEQHQDTGFEIVGHIYESLDTLAQRAREQAEQ